MKTFPLSDTQKVEPSYQVVFGDDDRLDLFTDRRKMQGARGVDVQTIPTIPSIQPYVLKS